MMRHIIKPQFVVLFLSSLLFFIACNSDETPTEIKKTFSKVNGFIISDSGDKFLATDSGMFVLNERTLEFDFYINENDVKPFNDLKFTTSSEVLWLASNEGILNISDDKLVNSGNSGLKSNLVHRLDFDYFNRGIFANPDGLSINDNGKWIFSSGQNDLYQNHEITDVASAVNGYTYVTTNGGGIERFEMGVDGISSATIFDSDWTLLESNNINTVYIDSITQAYGTDMGVGLHFSEFTKWDWEFYSTVDGLIDNNVISVLKDKSGNWWFGTNVGLSRFDNSNWTNYTVQTDAILSDHIKFLAIDTDGSVWFASDKGLSQFMNNQWTNYKK